MVTLISSLSRDSVSLFPLTVRPPLTPRRLSWSAADLSIHDRLDPLSTNARTFTLFPLFESWTSYTGKMPKLFKLTFECVSTVSVDVILGLLFFSGPFNNLLWRLLQPSVDPTIFHFAILHSMSPRKHRKHNLFSFTFLYQSTEASFSTSLQAHNPWALPQTTHCIGAFVLDLKVDKPSHVGGGRYGRSCCSYSVGRRGLLLFVASSELNQHFIMNENNVIHPLTKFIEICTLLFLSFCIKQPLCFQLQR